MGKTFATWMVSLVSATWAEALATIARKQPKAEIVELPRDAK